MVKVPVLSKSIILTPVIFSKTLAPLINTPLIAPTPVPTITAVGAANPKAQGQATTITEIDNFKQTKNFPLVSFWKIFGNLS